MGWKRGEGGGCTFVLRDVCGVNLNTWQRGRQRWSVGLFAYYYQWITLARFRGCLHFELQQWMYSCKLTDCTTWEMELLKILFQGFLVIEIILETWMEFIIWDIVLRLPLGEVPEGKFFIWMSFHFKCVLCIERQSIHNQKVWHPNPIRSQSRVYDILAKYVHRGHDIPAISCTPCHYKNPGKLKAYYKGT